MNEAFIKPDLADNAPGINSALARAAEEAAEIVKEAMKAQRFGLTNRFEDRGECRGQGFGPTNAEKILAEFKDLRAALVDAGLQRDPMPEILELLGQYLVKRDSVMAKRPPEQSEDMSAAEAYQRLFVRMRAALNFHD